MQYYFVKINFWYSRVFTFKTRKNQVYLVLNSVHGWLNVIFWCETCEFNKHAGRRINQTIKGILMKKKMYFKYGRLLFD